MHVHLYAFVCMCLCIYVGFIYLCIYLDTAYKRACMSIHVLIMLYFIYTKKKNVGGETFKSARQHLQNSFCK